MSFSDSPTGVPANSSGGTRDWLFEARAALDAGDEQHAIYAAREALALDGNSAEAWSIRSRASFILEHFDDAAFEAGEAVRLAPSIAQTHIDLGSALEVLQRYDDALREFEEAVRLDPSSAHAAAGIGSVHLSAGRFTEAVEAFTHAHDEFSDEPVVSRFLAEALYEEAEGQTTQLPGDRHTITSPAQIAVIRRNAERALALRFDDAELRENFRSLQHEADLAERKRWSRPNHPFVYLIALFVSLAAAGYIVQGPRTVLLGLVGVVALVGVVWLFVSRHYRPSWQYNAAGSR